MSVLAVSWLGVEVQVAVLSAGMAGLGWLGMQRSWLGLYASWFSAFAGGLGLVVLAVAAFLLRL